MQELIHIVDELATVLADERDALRRFDAEGLDRCRHAKESVAQRLATAVASAGELAPGQRQSLHRELSRARWAAEANRALLAGAADLLASVRAMPSSTGTYDRRARIAARGGGGG